MLERYVELQGYTPHRKDNIWLMSRTSIRVPTVMLCSHIDTVKPVAGWSYNPICRWWIMAGCSVWVVMMPVLL